MSNPCLAQKIFIGPTEIAGVAQGLHEGFCELGIVSEIILSVAHPFQYKDTPRVWWQRIWLALGALRVSFGRDKLLRKVLSVMLHNLWGVVVLLIALYRFDAFIFLFGQTFTNTRFELWMLRRLRKKIIFIYAGSESRPPFVDGGIYPGLPDDPIPSAAVLQVATRRCKKRVAMQEKYADYIVCSPTTAHFLTREYINWFAMGLPKRQDNHLEYTGEVGRAVKILHGPSNPLVKGSHIILQTIQGLIDDGYSIELIKLQGVSHARVLEALAYCDFVVDQVYSDTPMAALATEAAFFGKPSIVCGYFASEVGRSLRSEQIAPSLFVDPSKLKSAIKTLIEQPDVRRSLGRSAQRFVREQWGVATVAERYMQLLNGSPDEAWWSDPYSIRYVAGCGLPLERAKRMVGTLLDTYGQESFQLSDKPELQAAFVALARQPGKDEQCA